MNIENQLAGLAFASILIEAVVFGLLMLALYYAIRCGVRDGIRDAEFRPSNRHGRQEPH